MLQQSLLLFYSYLNTKDEGSVSIAAHLQRASFTVKRHILCFAFYSL